MSLFESTPQLLLEGAWLLPAFALSNEQAILADIEQVIAHAPLQQMAVPSGAKMSVITSSCGELGWVSDKKGYRYERFDPATGSPWPAMPETLFNLATQSAMAAGYQGFVPDACLINVYQVGARMGLHQDKDEQDFTQPIVSVSLGLPATFQFGGFTRACKTQKIQLQHGDVLVFGGASRMRFHGVLPVKTGMHHLLGARRINLTFRKAG